MNILVDEKDELKVAFEKADLGIVNMVARKLIDDKDVTYAACDYTHPLEKTVVLSLKCKSPKKKLVKAVDVLESTMEEFKAAVQATQ